MSKVKTFDSDNFGDIQADLVIKMREIAKQYGISLKVVKARYSNVQGSFFIKAAILGKDGQVKSQEAEDFKRYATSYGLKPDDLGKTFMFRGKPYTIAGALPRRRKYPILGLTPRGRRLIFPAAAVVSGMTAKEVIDKVEASVSEGAEE